MGPVDLISCKRIVRDPKSKPKQASLRPSFPVPEPWGSPSPSGDHPRWLPICEPFVRHIPRHRSWYCARSNSTPAGEAEPLLTWGMLVGSEGP